MKIFLAFMQGKPDHPIPSYSFWEFYIKKGIEEAGHTWVECDQIDWAYGLIPKPNEQQLLWKANTWEQTLNFLKETSVDLFLGYLYPEVIDEIAIYEIRKRGIPCVNFYCDHVRHFSTLPKEFKVFDLMWVPEHKALQMYQIEGITHLNLPMPMWIDPTYRFISKVTNQKVSFIGSNDIQRKLFFEKFIKKFPLINLEIYGAGWLSEVKVNLAQPNGQYVINTIFNQFSFIKQNNLAAYVRKLQQRKLNNIPGEKLAAKVKKRLSYEEYIEVNRNSLVTIGINRFPSFNFPLDKPNSYSRLRDIEAPMLGACYITEFTEGIEKMYDLNKEILVYNNAEELKEKIDLIKNNSDLRMKMMSLGQLRALREHSIPNTIEKIANKLFK